MAARRITAGLSRGGALSNAKTSDSSSKRTAAGRPLVRVGLVVTVLVATVLAGTGGLIAPVAAESSTDEGLQVEVREMNEEYVAVEVYAPEEIREQIRDPGSPVFLGHADRFVIHDDGEWVSLPEDTEGLARPVEVERLDEQTYLLYFRTGELDLSEADGDEVVLGLGVFPERTVPGDHWNVCPGHRDY